MAVKIVSFEVEVPGSVTRKFDTKSGNTTLKLDEVQAAALVDELTPVVAFNQTFSEDTEHTELEVPTPAPLKR